MEIIHTIEAMKSKLIYVELKSGHNDNGPAWIGMGLYNRTGQTIYFNGKIFKNGKGVSSNHYDAESHEEYWISGVKKDGTDRHKSGSGIIHIDESIVSDYCELVGLSSLPKGKFRVVKLDNIPAKEKGTDIANKKK